MSIAACARIGSSCNLRRELGLGLRGISHCASLERAMDAGLTDHVLDSTKTYYANINKINGLRFIPETTPCNFLGSYLLYYQSLGGIMPAQDYNHKKRYIVGTSAPARISDTDTSTHKPFIQSIPQKCEPKMKVWTAGRTLPILCAIAIILLVVGFRPSANLVLLAVLGQVLCATVVWREWVGNN